MILAVALAGCVTTPSERPHAGALPQAWRDAPQTTNAAGQDQLVNWWAGFGDRGLNDFIAEGLAEGPSVQIAALRVREARALSYSTLSAYLPELTATGGGQYNRAVDGPGLVTAAGGVEREQGASAYGAQASWEIPWFARLHAAALGARANTQQSLADERAAKVALAADLAQAYVDLRAAQASTRALTESVAASDRLAGILDVSARAGFAAPADAADARRQAETARAGLAQYAIQERAAEGRIAVLRGHAPGADTALAQSVIAAEQGVPSLPIASAPAAPADLVRLRPDVASAEGQALVAAAALGIARADLLPQLHLTGAINVSDNVIGQALPEAITRVSATPLVTIPLFDWGSRIAAIRQRDAQFQEALIQYRQTVNAAVADATNALSSLDQGARRLTAARAAADAAETTLRGRRSAYDAGVLSLSDLLLAEQQTINARLSLVSAEAAQAGAGISVYRAFGGGPPDALAR